MIKKKIKIGIEGRKQMITEEKAEKAEENRSHHYRVGTMEDPKVRTYHIIHGLREVGKFTASYYKKRKENNEENDRYVVGFAICNPNEKGRYNKKIKFEKSKGRKTPSVYGKFGQVVSAGRMRKPRAYKNTVEFVVEPNTLYKDVEALIGEIFLYKYTQIKGYRENITNHLPSRIMTRELRWLNEYDSFKVV